MAATPAPDPPHENRFYTRVFVLCTVAILGLACYHIIAPFIRPLGWAALLAFLLGHTHEQLTRRLGNRAQLSALLLTLLAWLLLVGPLTALGGAFVQQASSLLQNMQELFGNRTRGGLQQLIQYPQLRGIRSWLYNTLGISSSQLREWLTEGSHTLVQFLANFSGQLFLGALSTVMELLLMLFFLFFFIRDGSTMLRMALELIPMHVARRRQLYGHLAAVTRAVVIGTGLTALIQGALVGVAFWIVDLPSPLVFGVLAALLSLLPIGGTAIIWLPAVGLLALQERWVAASFLLIWGALLVSMIDNFLKPLLISGRAEIATLTVFIGVLGGVGAFGAIGLFIGPVVLALVVALLRLALEIKREAEAGAHAQAPADAPTDSDGQT